jgi:hypothetical protein
LESKGGWREKGGGWEGVSKEERIEGRGNRRGEEETEIGKLVGRRKNVAKQQCRVVEV